MNAHELINEARKRGYRKGTPIRYVSHAIDFVQGEYLEVQGAKLLAYNKPKHQRKSFDDFVFDTLFDGERWVDIVDLSKRTEEQKRIDDMHSIY